VVALPTSAPVSPAASTRQNEILPTLQASAAKGDD
jgi:hypothetical protein